MIHIPDPEVLRTSAFLASRYALAQTIRQLLMGCAGDRVSELILGRSALRGLLLFIIIVYLTIGKRIRSNTLSPLIIAEIANNMGLVRIAKVVPT